MAVIPGDPSALRSAGHDYAQTAETIRQAVSDLNEIANPHAMVSLAIDSVRSDAASLALEISRAEERYRETGEALLDYASALEAAQDEALAAQRAKDDSQDALSTNRRRSDATRDELADAIDGSAEMARIERSLRDLGAESLSLTADIAGASARLDAAIIARDHAAQLAIARIRAVVDDSSLNDSLWDNFAGALSDFFEFVAKVVLAAALTVLAALLAVVLAVVALALAVIVLIAAIVLLGIALVAMLVVAAIALALLAALVVAAVIAAFVAVVIIAGLIVVTLALITMLAVALAFIVTVIANVLFIASIVALALFMTIVQMLPMLIFAAVTIITAAIAWRMWVEQHSPTPDVSEFVPDASSKLDGPYLAWMQANNPTEMTSLADYVLAEGLADKMGGSAETVVDIKGITNADGESVWVVTLPSTQDWQVAGPVFGQDMNGDGAVNDLDTNIILMLNPSVKTQYERAVLEAMQQAGIGPNDPVMLVGFSQGGILAAHMAANRSDAFNFEAVLAYGAPIDKMDIPSKTDVISMQHIGDVVPKLDLKSPAPPSDTWVTHTIAPPSDINPDGGKPYSDQPHNNSAYKLSAERLVEQDETVDDAFNRFMGTISTKNQYVFSE